MQDPRLIRADFVTALGLVALGLGTMVESWRMPRLEEMHINPYTVPGLVPGILGTVLAVLGFVLLLRSARAGGWRLWAAEHPGATSSRREVRRAGLTLALTIGYAGGLVGRVPFWLATFSFVFAFTVLFEWQRGRSRRATVRALAIAALLAGLVAAAVTAVFQYLFLVRLP